MLAYLQNSISLPLVFYFSLFSGGGGQIGDDLPDFFDIIDLVFKIVGLPHLLDCQREISRRTKRTGK